MRTPAMRYHIVFPTLFALLAAAATAMAAPHADFSGAWQLVPDKSTGLPSGMTQTMTVKQSADRLDVEVKLGGPGGERTLTDAYIVNGKEAEFTPALMAGGTPKSGKRISRWQTDGTGFDVTEEALIDSIEGTDTIKGKRTWRLSQDGKELTIEIDLQGDQGPIQSKRVFMKQ
ncbi:MAG TPA: hypothetical protein VF683_03985 [Chthoniobacterales bacterium]